MGVSKTELFNEQQNEVAKIAKALAHPARVAILELISQIDGCICSDLVDETGLSQPTISQHLTVLKNAGLIRGTVHGSSRCYCIDYTQWTRLKYCLKIFLNKNISEGKNIDHKNKLV